MGLSDVGGPILSGLLIEANIFDSGWRMTFLINVPLGLAALAGAWRFFPEARQANAPRLDVLGVAAVSVGSMMIIYPLVQGREQDRPTWMVGMLVAAVPFWAGVAWYQARRHARMRVPARRWWNPA